MSEKTEDNWVNIANDFCQRTQFLNWIDAVDGKHIWIKMPTGSGSLFYNYKHFFSIILLPLVDANYCFIAVDVGPVGKSSESNVFKNKNMGRKLESNQLESQGAGCCLTRARWMVECAFSMLANKWRIFHGSLDLTLQFCDSIVKAWCILHNFIRWNDGFQLEDTLYERNFESIQAAGTRWNNKGKHVRYYFTKYFMSSHGAVPWQYDKVRFGIWHTLKKYWPLLTTTTKL
jgi:hypothetical protein